MPCITGSGYVAPAPIYVTTTTPGQPNPFQTISVESALAVLVQQVTSDPGVFLQNPPPFGSFAACGPVPSAIQASLLASINQRCTAYPSTCDGLDKNALAAKYTAILIATLQAIPACAWDQSLTTSVYDNWGKGSNPNACPPGWIGQRAADGTGCAPAPCPPGYAHYPYADSPCAAVPSPAIQVTPGKSQQTAPTGSVPVQTTPTNYGQGTQISTPGGSSTLANGNNNGQTPFVSANLIPASTLEQQMQAKSGYTLALPSAWCGLMAQLLGGFTCPALALDYNTPVNSITFLAALRKTEMSQSAAPGITQGGFTMTTGAGDNPQVMTPNAGVTPPAPFSLSPVAIGIIVAAVVVFVLVRR